ncbi:MAG: amidohydrolase family protein [Bacteroidales bacterium]|jgi:cytosine/adenosine deaminase-related metal-dependent hydrolase|nr:amidohydrolase family protein [Bacteroidales bacterium]
MKHFSAQYVFTCTGPPLSRPLITATDDGTIVSVTDTGGKLPEISSLAYYNGIITPGFVNCHCHLELSHFAGKVEPGTGLPGFIQSIRRLREVNEGNAEEMAVGHDAEMASAGIVACADICNGTDSFRAKETSSIFYVSLIEVFGINPEKAGKRFGEALAVARQAMSRSLEHNITPHSAYALSLPLMSMVKQYGSGYPLSAIHFMESADETELLERRGGTLLEYYREFGIDAGTVNLPGSHADAVINHVTTRGNLILVHNTHADENTIDRVNARGNTCWCLCPRSNNFISGAVPPVPLLRKKNCTIVIGTDSLASVSSLSILSELIELQRSYPGTTFQEMIAWASVNGARALGIDSWAGTIEPGKRPGLLLISDTDLANLKLTDKSKVRRLI